MWAAVLAFVLEARRRRCWMIRMLSLFALFLFVVSVPMHAENVEGHLVDKMCSAKVLKGGAEAAKGHTKSCALMTNCKGSGFGVVTADGRFIKFDADGDRMAEKMLDISSDDEDIRVTVNGKIDGDTMAVVAIQFL